MLKSFATKAMLTAGVATVAMSAMSAPAEAFTVFTDRALWQNAVNGLSNPAANPVVTETFQGITPGFKTSPYTTPATGITFTGGSLFVGPFNGNPGQNLVTSFGGPNSSNATVSTPSSLALGFDIQNAVLPQFVEPIKWALSSGLTGTFTPSSSSFDFLGFVAQSGDPLLTSVGLSIADGSGVGVLRLDNVSYATLVPTPALLPGLIGMGVAALRKKRKGEAEAADA